MKKKGFLHRFIRLSKPTGPPQWGRALRAIILMVLAGLVAKFLGFDNGIRAIMFVTLLSSMIIDISLPIRKVATLTLLGFLMTVLAFISASLALSSLEVFILFTVLWSFFSISLYIFGNIEGSLGFSFFLIYFTAVLLVNNQSSTLDWAIYSALAYLVLCILFIPKLWLEKKRIHDLVTVGFIPDSSFQNVMAARNILSGIPLNSNYYDIFKLGSYLKGLRSYSNLVSSRLTPDSQMYFNKFLKIVDELSLKIADHLKKNKGPVDLKDVNKEHQDENKSIKSYFSQNKEGNETVLEIYQTIQDILKKSNSILNRDPGEEVRKIETTKKSLKEVLTANFNLNNLYIRHSIRFTIAITLALIIVYLTRERSAIWVTMGVLIILKPDITSTIDNLISRVGFNLFAIILAIIISFIFPHNLLIWLAFIMLFLFRAFYPHYMGLSVMAITVFIVLIWPTGTVVDNALARLIDISIGGIIAFVCAYLILPSRVTVNLPDQLYRTIKANIRYVNQVLVTSSEDFNFKNASKSFKEYLREENNLESAVKKLEDTFYDIDDDISFYEEIIVSNNKIAADLTAVASMVNKDAKSLKELDNEILKIKKILQNLETSIDEDVTPPGLSLKTFSQNYTSPIPDNDLKQLLFWIISDLELLQINLKLAHQNGVLERYTNLT